MPTVDRILIELEIPFATRWHIGSGESGLLADRLIVREAANRPYIPGSTLKGVVRCSCEKLSCTLHFPEPSDPHGTGAGLSEARTDTSPIDVMFGTKYHEGSLVFRDAYMDADDAPAPIVRSRIARHRILKTAREKHLFTTEDAAPTVFRTRIEGWNRSLHRYEGSPPYAYCLLIAGILAVQRIGGHGSTGSGWLDGAIRIKHAVYNDEDILLEDILTLLEPAFINQDGIFP